jgi:spore coat polysaccharide biosynthesis protein SpsF
MATAILQARIGSSRLPGKTLMEMGGKPMLWHAATTLRTSPGVDTLVLAVPEGERDDPLERLSGEWGVACVRGPEDDVLSRFVRAAEAFPDDFYFRATGDNPVLDRDNPLRTLRFLREKRADYVCEAGLPLGTLVEGFTREALLRTQREAAQPYDREHVTMYMKKSGRFHAAFPACPPDRRWPELSLTVDTAEDFARVRTVVESLYGNGVPDFLKVIDFFREKGATEP